VLGRQEAQELGSITRDYGIDKGIRREAVTRKRLEVVLGKREGKLAVQRSYCRPARQLDYHRRYPVSEGVNVAGGGLQQPGQQLGFQRSR